MYQYQNGNADIVLESTGSRTISYEGDLKLEYPLNLDIRVSTSCSFADNVCKDFCHESAIRKGKDADYTALLEKLEGLPAGIELAIGCNEFTQELSLFLKECELRGYVCNLTINQGHVVRDLKYLNWGIKWKFVKGLGISYRSSLKWNIPDSILKYSNTVFHIIAGIDKFEDVLALSEKGVKKILILGEKDFGYNFSKVNLTSRNHKEWYWWIHKLFSKFDVVSFDNLALEQLNVKRFLKQDDWNTFYQGEYSFYIDAVNQTFARSSRSAEKTDWNVGVKEYFKSIK